MTRFNGAALLVREDVEYEEDGSTSITREEKPAFVNFYDRSAYSVQQARAQGLRADLEIQLRSCDYDLQQAVSIGGTEYKVEQVIDSGEFTRLTLRRRLSNE